MAPKQPPHERYPFSQVINVPTKYTATDLGENGLTRLKEEMRNLYGVDISLRAVRHSGHRDLSWPRSATLKLKDVFPNQLNVSGSLVAHDVFEEVFAALQEMLPDKKVVQVVEPMRVDEALHVEVLRGRAWVVLEPSERPDPEMVINIMKSVTSGMPVIKQIRWPKRPPPRKAEDETPRLFQRLSQAAQEVVMKYADPRLLRCSHRV